MSASVVVEGYGAKIQQHRIVGGGGTTLNVLETGKRDGPTVLFIHGFSQNALAWSKQLNSELARDFRLVAMDIRGHGNSDKPPKDAYTDSKLWADDVQAVIESLELNRPVLSGWSYGGLIMCDYLSVYGENAIGGLNFVSAITRVGESVFPYLGQEFLAQVPGFFSNDVQESSAALQRFLHLCVHDEPSAEDFYFFLGYNAIVPPYVREASSAAASTTTRSCRDSPSRSLSLMVRKTQSCFRPWHSTPRAWFGAPSYLPTRTSGTPPSGRRQDVSTGSLKSSSETSAASHSLDRHETLVRGAGPVAGPAHAFQGKHRPVRPRPARSMRGSPMPSHLPTEV